MVNKPVKVKRNGKVTEVIYLSKKDREADERKIKAGRGFFGRIWDRIVFGFKALLGATSAVAFIYALLVLGGILFPSVHFQTVEAIREIETPSPVLQRIAGCESQGNAKLTGTQFDRNGQVLMRSNTNRSVDIGKYQINTVWFKKATELGFDLTTEAGNENMAMWIYKNRGTGDWSASAKCWKK